MFLTINGLIKVENVPELYRDYLEADTRVTFEKKSKLKPNENPLDRIKSVDPTTSPPNYNTLYEQIKRAWYIASIYKTTTEPCPSFENDPVFFGYQLSNNRSSLEMKWFHGDQVPRSLEEITDENKISGDDDLKNEGYNEDDDSDISDEEWE